MPVTFFEHFPPPLNLQILCLPLLLLLFVCGREEEEDLKVKEVDFSQGQGEKHPDRRGYQTPAVCGLLRRKCYPKKKRTFHFEIIFFVALTYNFCQNVELTKGENLFICLNNCNLLF